MNYYESQCFTIGDCEYPVDIEYDQCSEGDITIHKCMIEVAASKPAVWAKVDPEYYPAIESQLKQDLEEMLAEQAKFSAPDNIEWHGNKYRRAS